MHASTTGDRLLIAAESLEAIKWLALVLMLAEHASFFVFGVMPWTVFFLGRLVFPLFAIAIAYGIAHKTPAEKFGVVYRLVAWGCAAGLAGALVRDALPMNVLFTFALGITLDVVWRLPGVRSLLIGMFILCGGLAVEYGPFGVVAVSAFMVAARAETRRSAVLYLGIGATLICLANANLFAAFAPLVAVAISAGGIEVPRIKRLFYWTYAGQWPVFAVVRALA